MGNNRRNLEIAHPGLKERLGTETDEAIGRRYGLTRARVHQIRQRLGIPCFEFGRREDLIKTKLEAIEQELGQKSDYVLAKEHHLPVDRIRKKRVELGLPTAKVAFQNDTLAKIKDRLGKVSDSSLARELGISVNSIFQWRKAAGIPCFKPSPRSKHYVPIDGEKVKELFHQAKTDAEIASAVGCSRGYVGMLRRKLGLLRRKG